MCPAPPVTMATLPPNLIRTPHAIGVMEYWNIGVWTHHSTTPILQHSNFSFQSLQMFLEIQRLPPGLDAQRLGDDTRRIVPRRTGNIPARKTGRAAQIKPVDGRPILTPAGEWPVFQRLITGVLSYHPIAAIHIAIMPLDIQRRRRIRRKNVILVQVRRKALPGCQLFLKPFTANFVPVERIAPKI